MSDHASRIAERHCDVTVIGGSAAGLAAALVLGRQRRSVIVVDDGHLHGFLSREVLPPSVTIADRRSEVRSYGGEILADHVDQVTHTSDGHVRCQLASGNVIVAHRVLDAADGSGVEAMISSELAGDDQAAARPSANAADWDHRYSGEQMWSGNPNGTLVREVNSMAAGRALDVGAGEGGDALWLAGQGWQVTASDISRRALDRIATEAQRRGLTVACLHADANALDPFEAGVFDLVSAHYASIPRTPDGRAVRNLMAAVAPGGTLLVVSHDLDAMRAPHGSPAPGRPFDPDAYVGIDDIAAAVTASPYWEVEVHEKRPRPPGAASASHHVDDVVLRARRRTG